MSKDTTQPGVSEAEAEGRDTDQSIARPRSVMDSVARRDESMDEIVKKAREKRQADEEQLRADRADTEVAGIDDEVDTQRHAEAEAEPEVDAEAEAAAKAEAEGPTIKVDGEVIPVSQEEIDEAGGITALQKERAAANRLREAAATKKENDQRDLNLQQREERIAQREAELAAGKTITPQPSTKDADGKTPSERARALVEALYSADEDRAAAAIEEIMARDESPATPIDYDAIANRASELAAWKSEKQNGNAVFARDYPELHKNERLKSMVNEETIRLNAEHPDWGPQRIITAAADKVRDDFKDVLIKQDRQLEDKDRLNRKRATDQVTGTGAKPVKPAATKPPTPSDVVASMQAKRTGSRI